jgi:hypothetical protein
MSMDSNHLPSLSSLGLFLRFLVSLSDWPPRDFRQRAMWMDRRMVWEIDTFQSYRPIIRSELIRIVDRHFRTNKGGWDTNSRKDFRVSCKMMNPCDFRTSPKDMNLGSHVAITPLTLICNLLQTCWHEPKQQLLYQRPCWPCFSLERSLRSHSCDQQRSSSWSTSSFRHSSRIWNGIAYLICVTMWFNTFSFIFAWIS